MSICTGYFLDKTSQTINKSTINKSNTEIIVDSINRISLSMIIISLSSLVYSIAKIVKK